MNVYFSILNIYIKYLNRLKRMVSPKFEVNLQREINGENDTSLYNFLKKLQFLNLNWSNSKLFGFNETNAKLNTEVILKGNFLG